MEKLKSLIPQNLKQTIEKSTPNDLTSTCSSLNDFFSQLPLFHSMIDDLTNPQVGLCAKSKEQALELKLKGNAAFSSGDYSQALQFYSKALRVVPVDAVDKDNNLAATLYLNRASSLNKLCLLDESLRDCNRSLSICPKYAKAWYRRARVNISLSNFEDAIPDLRVAMSMERTLSGKRQIENDLKSIVSQSSTGTSSSKFSGNQLLLIDEVPQAQLECVSTPTKGRGMASLCEIPPATLVHKEEPYATIILKNVRETHCHHCFNELPVDFVPCLSCSIPLYCSEECQVQAGGHVSRKHLRNKENDNMLSSELEKHFSKVTLKTRSDLETEHFNEHGHECCGVTWPAVFPSDVVLAARAFVKLMELNDPLCERADITRNLDLAQNYIQLSPENKLELHVYSAVLVYCLSYSFASKLELSGAMIAKVIFLNSQIKINSMAIVRMKCVDACPSLKHSVRLSSPGNTVTSNLEQVKVGQAIYLTGSLFNHSCVPNIHAYFISRTLLIRATDFLAAGCSLELSYGPQVGESDYQRRQDFLQDKYSFNCPCIGCTKVNLPDLALNAFRCVKSNCLGIVLDPLLGNSKRHKICQLQQAPEVRIPRLQQQVDKLNNKELEKMARLFFQQSNTALVSQSGCCLSCGSVYNLKALLATVALADEHIRSLREDVYSNKVDDVSISKAFSSLEVLRSTLHSYNKKLAEAEDILAQAFCVTGKMRQARDHCIASIKILRKLYHPGHIAVGNELVKLSSIQLALADPSAADTIKQTNAIFSNYYGRHAEVIFPYLQHLRVEEVCDLFGGQP